MKPNTPTTLLDLIFEGRNCSYGAYALRKGYPDTVLKALALSLIAFSLGIAIPKIWEKLGSGLKPIEKEMVLINPKMIAPPPIDPKTPPPPPLPSSPPPPQVNTIRFVPPEVAADEEVIEEDPPKQEDLKKAVTDDKTVEGDPNADPNELLIDGNSTGNAAEVIGIAEDEELFTAVEEMPSFPEGDAQAFFARNIRYPQRALNKEIQGKIFVSFIVKNDGTISDPEILKGLGFGLDEEVLRVVKMMPKWNPGKQGGRPVKVKIIQPVIFKI